MTTVTTTIQPTTPPRILITVDDVVTPPVSLLTNGSFETPNLGGALTNFTPDGWTNGIGSADVAPVQFRQGPNATVATAPALGARYFHLEFPGSTTKQNGAIWQQDQPVAEGMRVVADAKAATLGTPGAGTFLVGLIPLRGTQTGGNPGVGTINTPAAAWTNAHAEVTIPPGYDAVRILFQYLTTAANNAVSRLLVDAFTATASEPVISSVSLMREVDGVRSPVRGAQNLTAPGTDLVINDVEAPFGKSITYVFVKTYVDGTTGEFYSAPVELTTELPWISHPITGVGVTATITEWPELTYAARRTIIAVAGRSRPITISDKRIAPSSQITMLTKTRSDLLALRELLALGDVLLVRPVCDAVEGDYLAIGDVTETRVKPTGDGAGSDWRRLVSMDAQAVDIPDTLIPAVGDTLTDLAAFVPTTLADLANAFGANATLLTIAQTNLSAG